MSGINSLAVLEGVWRINRVIAHDDGLRDSFVGQAVFTRSGPRIIHDEDGWLTTGEKGQRLRATRRYVWTNENGRIDVAFGDMRPFHSIPVGVSKPETTYLCPPDRYQVAYDFEDFPSWTMTWRVDGPRKGYEMVSNFSREDA